MKRPLDPEHRPGIDGTMAYMYKLEEYVDYLEEQSRLSNDGGFTLNDLKSAFDAGRKMSWTDVNQEEQEPYYYSFDEWYNGDRIENKITSE